MGGRQGEQTSPFGLYPSPFIPPVRVSPKMITGMSLECPECCQGDLNLTCNHGKLRRIGLDREHLQRS